MIRRLLFAVMKLETTEEIDMLCRIHRDMMLEWKNSQDLQFFNPPFDFTMKHVVDVCTQFSSENYLQSERFRALVVYFLCILRLHSYSFHVLFTVLLQCY
jgi:hypothetical protein